MADSPKMIGVINRNMSKQVVAVAPTKVRVVEEVVAPIETTWANVLVSGDNRISYYLKYKDMKWSELC